ncbi:hypothetical protein BDR03DRAFT_1018967 [Suillus americanus]|nr:hypothetical protein BDR03DRAFT_1018967 [Suillus americanus]
MALHYVLVGRSDTEKSDDAKAKIVKTEAQLEIQSSWLPFAPEEQGAAVSSEPNSGAEDSGHGYNATAAVVSCEGTPINIDRRHASSGMEDLGTSVGDLGVDTSTTTGAHMIKATVPSIHNGSLTTLVPETSRAEVPSKQSAPKSTTHVTASKISKRPRGSTANSSGHANKKARRTYADGNDLDSDDFVVVKATM